MVWFVASTLSHAEQGFDETVFSDVHAWTGTQRQQRPPQRHRLAPTHTHSQPRTLTGAEDKWEREEGVGYG